MTNHITKRLTEIFQNPAEKATIKESIRDAIRQRLEFESNSTDDLKEAEHEVSRGMAR